jgi:DeoR/GlpR family transcriptional regulator of sugar metabolism
MSTSSLSPEGRRAAILEYLARHDKITVEQVAKKFDVSEVTVRNDFRTLESTGKLHRTRGGASSTMRAISLSYPEERLGINAEAKDAIGKLAAKLVKDGDTIAVDSGSTTYYFIRHLVNVRDLTVVTADITIASFAAFSIPNAEITMPGGTLYKNHLYLTGPITIRALRNLYVDKSFLCCDGYSSGHGFTTRHEESSETKRAYISHSKTRAMLMDTSKVGRLNFSKFADLIDLDYIVTNDDPEGIISSDIQTASEVWSDVPKLLLAQKNE